MVQQTQISDIKGLVKVTGFVDRDMDARSLNFKLGQTPMKKILC